MDYGARTRVEEQILVSSPLYSIIAFSSSFFLVHYIFSTWGMLCIKGERVRPSKSTVKGELFPVFEIRTVASLPVFEDLTSIHPVSRVIPQATHVTCFLHIPLFRFRVSHI